MLPLGSPGARTIFDPESLDSQAVVVEIAQVNSVKIAGLSILHFNPYLVVYRT